MGEVEWEEIHKGEGEELTPPLPPPSSFSFLESLPGDGMAQYADELRMQINRQFKENQLRSDQIIRESLQSLERWEPSIYSSEPEQQDMQII